MTERLGDRALVPSARIRLRRARVAARRARGIPSLLELIGPAVAAAGAIALWASSLSRIHLRRMDDLGLVSVLPGRFLVALAILTVSFFILLRHRPLNFPLLLIHLGIVIFMLYGTEPLIEEVPRLTVSWRHAGIADFIARNGGVNPRLDAYFNWPGFFVLAALLTKLAGFRNPIALAAWAPVYFNLLFLGAVLMILRSGTRDDRLVWLGAWIFFVTDWVGQDYFSPQAFSYFVYLVILGILLTWFRRPDKGTAVGLADSSAAREGTAAQRVALMAVVVTLFGMMVPSHQLTPFATLAGVTALVVLRRCTAKGLHLLMAVILATWISFMTVAYLASHFHQLLAGVGDISGSLAANVEQRLQGSSGHLFVVHTRLLLTGGVGGLALLGGLRRLRLGHRDLAYACLAVAPFPLMALQPYGGEMLLRVYLFALPFFALFAAALFFPSPKSGGSWTTTLVGVLVCLGLLAGFLFSRYGNERVNEFTADEVDAVNHLYRIAPSGALLLAGTLNLPWRAQHYEQYVYSTVQRIEAQRSEPLPRLGDVVSATEKRAPFCAFVIISRAEKAYAEVLGIWPKGALERLQAQLRGSSLFTVAYANNDAVIFEYSGGVNGAQTSTAGALGGTRHPSDCRE